MHGMLHDYLYSNRKIFFYDSVIRKTKQKINIMIENYNKYLSCKRQIPISTEDTYMS